MFTAEPGGLEIVNGVDFLCRLNPPGELVDLSTLGMTNGNGDCLADGLLFNQGSLN